MLASGSASAATGTFVKAFVDSKVTNNDVAFGADAAQTSDGGYIVTGSVGTSGTDGWISKLSATGTVQWQKIIGSGGTSLESVQQTSDGGYVVAGGTNSESACAAFGFSTLSCAWVVKLTAAGAVTWQNVYPGSDQANAAQIRQTSDGGYIVAGSTSDRDGTTFAWLAKLNPQGAVQWQKQCGSTPFAAAGSVAQTSDGGYVITGECGAVGSESVLVAKFDGNGNPQWQQTYRDATGSSGSSIQPTRDGGYIVGGTDNERTGSEQALLVKLSPSGAVQFQDAFTPGPIGNNTIGSSVVQAPDGGYVLAGTFNFTPGGSARDAAWLVKVTSAGALSWQHIYTTSQSGLFQSVRLTSDGGYIAAGTADAFAFSNNVWLVKTDANGNVAGGTCKTEQASATGTSDGALAATATSFPGVTPAGTQPAATPDVASAGNLVTQTVC